VFVAGHNGLVGSALLRNAPSDISVLTANRDELDLCDPIAVDKFFRKSNPEAVILAAAKVGGIEANSNNQKDFLFENLQIQNTVMIAAAQNNVQNFVFLGSSCIYPKMAEQPISESALLSGPLEPSNEGYAIAKIAGIRLARAIYQEDNLNFFSLMPTNLYGPNDNFSTTSSHVPAALMRRFHEAKVNGLNEVTVWGSGSPRREFMHVDDLARACWFMIHKNVGGELINVGTGIDIDIATFSKVMAKVVGFEGKILFDETKLDGTPRKLLDVSKIHSYGWKHEIELEVGLSQTYAWFVNSIMKGDVRGY
jgi:GDP-L-fucose synthase